MVSLDIRKPAGFDYAAVSDARLRRDMERAADEYMGGMRKAAESYIAGGGVLARIKERCDHGAFADWIAGAFGISLRMAEHQMQVFRTFGGADMKRLENLSPSVLQILAAESTPPAARKQVLADAGRGPVTVRAAKAAAANAKPANGVAWGKGPAGAAAPQNANGTAGAARPANGKAGMDGAAGDIKADSPPPPAPVDAAGRALNLPRLRAAFAGRPAMLELREQIIGVKKWALELAKQPGGGAMDADQIKRYADDFAEYVADKTPDYICIVCAGEGCKTCGDSGYISKPTYKAIPADVRKAAEKAKGADLESEDY